MSKVVSFRFIYALLIFFILPPVGHTQFSLETKTRETLEALIRASKESSDQRVQTQVNQVLYQAVGKAQANVGRETKLRQGLKIDQPVDQVHLIEDILVLIYASNYSLELRLNILPELHLLMGHENPQIRTVIANWLSASFLGENADEKVFPSVLTTLSPTWERVLEKYQSNLTPSPMGKLLARLAYNAKFDSDENASRAAKIAWWRIEQELIDSRNRSERLPRRLSRSWLTEAREVQEEWARQRAYLRNNYVPLTINADPELYPELSKPVSPLLNHLKYGSQSTPPLPPCSEWFVTKKLLN